MEREKTRRAKANIKKKLFEAFFAVSLVLIMVSISYSWFTTGQRATVHGIQMQVAEGDNLSIKVFGPSEYGENASFEFPEMKDKMQARAGDGVYFYDAVLGSTDDEEIALLQEGDTSSETESKPYQAAGYVALEDCGPYATVEDYIKYGICAVDFSLKAGSATKVYLYGDSAISPADVSEYNDTENYPQGAMSPLGPLDQEGKLDKNNYLDIGNICGAIRVAILQKIDSGESGDGSQTTETTAQTTEAVPSETSTGAETSDPGMGGETVPAGYEVKLIWAPNSDIQLKEENGRWTLESDAAKREYESVYTYVTPAEEQDETGKKVRKIEIIPESAQEKSGYCVENDVVYAWGDITEKIPFADLNSGENDFRLIIWVDGHDRECRNALLSGQVQVVLHFGL